ncbi:hypothetical protein ACMGD3_14335 [Lysinibacillus sphaericus]|uniref:hypothetical protein n=1 Tax=Lysinibacillus sphaericus TaxID=1421 RepID=UPI001C5FE8DF
MVTSFTLNLWRQIAKDTKKARVKLTVNISFERNYFGNIAFKAKFDYAREGNLSI